MYQYFVGLDVHQQVIACCIKASVGAILNEGSIKARRFNINQRVRSIPGPWHCDLTVLRLESAATQKQQSRALVSIVAWHLTPHV